MSELLILFFEFFKIGLFSIGGGLATLPFLYQLADKYDWLTMDMIPNMIAISESTPGPLGVNMATYAGFQAQGVLGGIVATIGLIFPSIVIIIIVSNFLTRFRENKYVDYAFYLLRPAVTGLIGAAGFGVIVLALFNMAAFQGAESLLSVIRWKEWILFFVILFLTNKYKKHPIVYIVLGAVVGIAIMR